MIIVTRSDASAHEVDDIREWVERRGLRTYRSRNGRAVIGCVGDLSRICADELRSRRGVEQVIGMSTPYRCVARKFSPASTVVRVGSSPDAIVGGPGLAVIAGPCSVEGREMLRDTARAVRAAGATMLRGGAFKPRTSPYDFQGLGREGLLLLAEARAEFGLPVVTEVMDPRQVDLVVEHADVLQIGARSMQNFPLLEEVGRVQRPVILKRGLSATIPELLAAAEYIVAKGNHEVILCERGIRTFERSTRNTLDVAAIPVLKQETHLPVIADPSHASGKASLVAPLAFAAVAAGADGLLIEVHPCPAQALSDGEQSLTPLAFLDLMCRLRSLAAVVRRPPHTLHVEVA